MEGGGNNLVFGVFFRLYYLRGDGEILRSSYGDVILNMKWVNRR